MADLLEFFKENKKSQELGRFDHVRPVVSKSKLDLGGGGAMLHIGHL